MVTMKTRLNPSLESELKRNPSSNFFDPENTTLEETTPVDRFVSRDGQIYIEVESRLRKNNQ